MKKTIAMVSVLVVVFLCSSFPVFAASDAPVNRIGVTNDIFTPTGGSTIRASLSLTTFNPYMEIADSNERQRCVDVLGYLVVFNNNDQDLKMTGNKFYYFIQQANPAYKYYQSTNTENWDLTDVEYLGGQLNISYINTQNLFVFEKYNDEHLGEPSVIIIPANSNVCCYFKLHYTVKIYNAVDTFYTPEYTASTAYLASNTDYYNGTLGSYHENYYSYIPDMYDALLDIYSREGTISSQLAQILQAYNTNVPIAQDSTQSAQQSQTDANTQHQQELSIYSNTNNAINGTGLNNYHFNNEQIGGIGGVSNDFTSVFNSLGSWNNVYIFSLTLSLALAIIRHIRPNKRSQE